MPAAFCRLNTPYVRWMNAGTHARTSASFYFVDTRSTIANPTQCRGRRRGALAGRGGCPGGRGQAARGAAGGGAEGAGRRGHDVGGAGAVSACERAWLCMFFEREGDGARRWRCRWNHDKGFWPVVALLTARTVPRLLLTNAPKQPLHPNNNTRYLELERQGGVLGWFLNLGLFRDRLLMDNRLLEKLGIEMAVGGAAQMAAEWDRRRGKLWQELDFAFADVLTW